MLNKKRLISSYPDDVKKASALIAFNPEKLIYYGSASKKAMYLSSGDIDLVEPIKPNEANSLAKHIQTIVKNVLRTKDCYLGDFKSGINPYYDVDIGTIKNGKVVGFNKDMVYNFIKSRSFDNTLEKKRILSLFDKNKAFEMPSWFELYNFLHQYQVLRWNQEELLRGYKIVDGKKIYLQNTIQDKKALTKIDTIQFIKSLNRWVEITNYFDVVNNGKEFKSEKYIETLKLNLMKYYYERNWFKFTKRLLAYSLAMNETATSNKLFSIVHSGLGIMYQQYSELKAIEYLMKHYHKPLHEFQDQLQAIKMRLGNVYEFDFDEKEIDDDLDRGDIDAVIEKLYPRFNDYTYRQLKKLEILPLNHKYIP
jgi:hypothetical protein